MTPIRPTHPVELLACAIATQEGWFAAGSIPQIRRNPGDLRYANQLGAVAPATPPIYGHPQPIATFKSVPFGITALYRQLWLQVAQGQTVRQIIAQWAPPSENNTGQYLADVLQWTGLPSDEPVLELLPPLTALNQAETSPVVPT